jgi:hypothetical protein
MTNRELHRIITETYVQQVAVVLTSAVLIFASYVMLTPFKFEYAPAFLMTGFAVYQAAQAFAAATQTRESVRKLLEHRA